MKFKYSSIQSIEIPDDSAVAVLTGAGISAESGIMTFRSAGGVWEQHSIDDMATPAGFSRNPDLVWRFYSERRRQAAQCLPNPAHLALARLEQKLSHFGRFTLVTQNVDGLHQRAGSQNVLTVHGSLFETRCSNAACPKSLEPVPDLSMHMNGAPRCPECGGLLRPNVVWFGEYLDPAIESMARTAIADCDLFITVGTSGNVYPVAGYVDIANDRGARTVLVNLEAPVNRNRYGQFYEGPAGVVLPRLLDGE